MYTVFQRRRNPDMRKIRIHHWASFVRFYQGDRRVGRCRLSLSQRDVKWRRKCAILVHWRRADWRIVRSGIFRISRNFGRGYPLVSENGPTRRIIAARNIPNHGGNLGIAKIHVAMQEMCHFNSLAAPRMAYRQECRFQNPETCGNPNVVN